MTSRSLAVLPSLLLGLSLVALPAPAEKPDWAGKPGKGDKHKLEQRQPGSDSGSSPRVTIDVQIGGYFGDAQRRAAQDYYTPRFKAGKCPPGLAKKNNGCMPPGQAKQWQMGRPLPRDLVYYPVPSGISIQLGLPPAGHKYVRVAADILLIAIGTGMVVDAIEDLGRL